MILHNMYYATLYFVKKAPFYTGKTVLVILSRENASRAVNAFKRK